MGGSGVKWTDFREPRFSIMSKIKDLGLPSLGREGTGEGRHGVTFLTHGVKCG